MVDASLDLKSRYYSNIDLYLDYDELNVIVKALKSATFRGYTDFEVKTYNEFLDIFSEELSSYEVV